jgi:hypothetical protein
METRQGLCPDLKPSTLNEDKSTSQKKSRRRAGREPSPIERAEDGSSGEGVHNQATTSHSNRIE